MKTEVCCGCGVILPQIDGPVHRYMESSPSCWATYGQVLAREFSDPGYMAVHRLTVDTYAVQHPGRPSPQAIQSVACHLVSLHATIELKMPLAAATQLLGTCADTMQFEWMTPLPGPFAVTVADVWGATDAGSHGVAVEKWANAAWRGWEPHHARVRAWAEKALAKR
jgi:hypothetical protein